MNRYERRLPGRAIHKTARVKLIFLALLLAGFFLAALGVPAVSAQENLPLIRCQPLQAAGPTGQPLSVDIYVENAVDLYGAEVLLDFDTSMAQVIDAEPDTPESTQIELLSDFLQPEFVLRKIADNNAGTIHYAASQVSPTLPVSGGGPLARVTFQPLQTGTFSLAITDFELANLNGFVMPAQTQDCTVSFSGSSTTQVIDLEAGWNLVSSHMTPDNPALGSILGALEGDLVLVKDSAGNVYWPSYNVNQIGNWDVRQGYQIYITRAAVLTITGAAVDPAQTPITLPAGWNMAAYLRTSAMPISQAVASIEGQLYLAKNGAGEVYWPDLLIDLIGDMQPGHGYQLYMSSSGTLTYPDN